jgi:hypothetical protein
MPLSNQYDTNNPRKIQIKTYPATSIHTMTVGTSTRTAKHSQEDWRMYSAQSRTRQACFSDTRVFDAPYEIKYNVYYFGVVLSWSPHTHSSAYKSKQFTITPPWHPTFCRVLQERWPGRSSQCSQSTHRRHAWAWSHARGRGVLTECKPTSCTDSPESNM